MKRFIGMAIAYGALATPIIGALVVGGPAAWLGFGLAAAVIALVFFGLWLAS